MNGKRVGDISNDGPSRTDYAQALANRGAPQGNNAGWQPIGSADFDQNYEPISPIYPGAVATTYLVKNGDTLQSIASSVWGDSAMWYLIADANGLASGSSLVAGQVLTIPNKVANINNNAGTFRPYNPGEAIGDTSPTLPVAPSPPKKKKKCGGLGAILVAIVSIAVSIYLGPVVGNVAAAALGNVAGQVTGNLLGVQKGFDFKSFGTSVLTAGITQGLIGNGTTTTGVFGESIQKAFGNVLGNAGVTAARAVVGNITNQAVGNLTGSQQGFSWSSVAISGIGAAAGQFASKQLGINNINNPVAQDLARAAVNAGANALSQVVVRGGKINWQTVATDTILNFTSSRLQSYANESNANKNAALVAQQRRDAGVDNEPLYSTAPTQKGDFTRELLNSQAVEAAETYKVQLGLANTAPSAGGLSMSYPFTPDQYMKDDNAATTAAYFKRQQPETSVNKVKNQLANINIAKEVGFDYGRVDFLSGANGGVQNGTSVTLSSGLRRVSQPAVDYNNLPKWSDRLPATPAGTYRDLQGFVRPITPTSANAADAMLKAVPNAAINTINLIGNLGALTGGGDYTSIPTFKYQNEGLGFAAELAMTGPFAELAAASRLGRVGAAAGEMAGGNAQNISVFRKMSSVEADATLNTRLLQPAISGTNSSKYLSESLNKVIEFQNKGVSSGTSEQVLEFIIDKKGYDGIMKSSVNQIGSKSVDAIKYNFEGLSSTGPRNIGIPATKLDEFNLIIRDIRKVP